MADHKGNMHRNTPRHDKIKSKEHALVESQDVAEAQDNTLPTTSAEKVLLTRVIGGRHKDSWETR